MAETEKLHGLVRIAIIPLVPSTSKTLICAANDYNSTQITAIILQSLQSLLPSSSVPTTASPAACASKSCSALQRKVLKWN